MSFWAPPPEPATKLGRHRQLAPTAGVHVSPICLGAMSLGDKWTDIMGSMDKERSFTLLDAFYEAGGNFIDTSNNYQDETSEMFLGEWLETRGVRDQMVIATKYTSPWKRGVPHSELPQKTQFVGNNTKSLHLSVAASLKKLRTDYIDILYLHWWDYTTSVEEVMNGLHNLVVQGKVLYLGVSDTPAWVVSKANQYARMAGKTPFVIYQGAWSIMQRDLEREILPMVLSEGMALAPWNVLAAGKIRTDAEEKRRLESGECGRSSTGEWMRTEGQRIVCQAIEKVAGEIGAKNITSVAIAYVMQKAPYVFPIIGGRKVEHLYDNIEALDIVLSPEQIKYVDGIVPFDKGFPFTAFVRTYCALQHDNVFDVVDALLQGDGSEYNIFFKSSGYFDRWPDREAIRPTQK